jgi:hypothetical protein
MAGNGQFKSMTHQQVIENFVTKGQGGLGTYVRASDEHLYSKIPAVYRPYGHTSYRSREEQVAPLAVRLEDGGLLVNGARLDWPMHNHQNQLLRTIQHSPSPTSVVPYHSVVAAWTDGEKDTWNASPIPIRDLRKEVSIAVPSTGERWREVIEKDKHGRERKRNVHTLGDSVIRVKDRFYISAVDETGVGAGMYFLAELLCDRAPASFKEALDFLKPKVVQDAEERGTNVRRQGEWFAIPMMLTTSQLMRDVERGVAAYHQKHVLGRDGHHELEEAVIYKAGPRKGEVYARGVLTHTNQEHHDLDLGTIRWHLVVHNVQGPAYTLGSGGTAAQFD